VSTRRSACACVYVNTVHARAQRRQGGGKKDYGCSSPAFTWVDDDDGDEDEDDDDEDDDDDDDDGMRHSISNP